MISSRTSNFEQPPLTVAMSQEVDYARGSAKDPWVSFAVQQLREGAPAKALKAYEGVLKRFDETAHSQKLHENVSGRRVP